MNREIKFRAWDGKKMILSESVNFFVEFDGTVWENFGTYLSDMLKERNEFILMQFTGLHDKNGKEIYEGDILDGQMVVTWRNDLASFALSKQGWAYDHYFGEAVDPGQTEVIGNIHQNPELLQP